MNIDENIGNWWGVPKVNAVIAGVSGLDLQNYFVFLREVFWDYIIYIFGNTTFTL